MRCSAALERSSRRPTPDLSRMLKDLPGVVYHTAGMLFPSTRAIKADLAMGIEIGRGLRAQCPLHLLPMPSLFTEETC